MSTYVDSWNAKYRGMIMCHVIADSHEELLNLMDKIEVKRKWIQNENSYREHFDICLSKKKLAIKNGTIEISTIDLVRICRAKREGSKKG